MKQSRLVLNQLFMPTNMNLLRFYELSVIFDYLPCK